MSTKRPVSFANFVCRFGEYEMLDQIDDIVVPAFFSNRTRTYGETTYLIHEPNLVDVSLASSKPEPAIIGRLVKNTVLRSHQVFQDGALSSSSAKLEAAPSSVFVLLLKSHKLIYFSEFPGSPGLEAFQNTILYLLKASRVDYVNELYELANENRPDSEGRVTKKSVAEGIPIPTLEVIPLTNEETLQEQLNRFAILKTVSVRLVRPNNEIDASKFFAQARSTAQEVKSEQTTLSFRGPPEGLVKSAVKDTVEGALTGNAQVAMTGTTESGAKLSIKNDDMKVAASAEVRREPLITTARRLMGIYRGYISQKLIAMAPEHESESVAIKLARVMMQMVSDDLS